MYAVNLLFHLNKSFSNRARTVLFSLNKPHKYFFNSKHTTSFSKKIDVNDVVLYSYEKPTFFLFMLLGSGIQCACWTYLGGFLYDTVKSSDLDEKRRTLWKSFSEKERKYSDVLSGIALFFGWAMLFATSMYALRSVRKITLHRGGKTLTIVTYSLPGHNELKVPLSWVSSSLHRNRAKKFIPLKIKNKLFFYLIDINGEFHNPELFDHTAGVFRNFSK